LSEQTAAGLVLVAVPILFNVCFALLAQRFDYPDILRLPSREVLQRFRAGGSGLILAWWAFSLSAVLFSAVAVLLAIAADDADPTLVILGAVVGVLASVVQFLGLVRWPFLVPFLARESAEAEPGSVRAETVDVVFQAMNRYLGVGVGEHLGYLFTGLWSILAGIALCDSTVVPDWLGILGVAIGPLFILCSLEFVGSNEQSGWEQAGKLTPIAYIVWSIWLFVLGVALLS
jgi:hypothetical protein